MLIKPHYAITRPQWGPCMPSHMHITFIKPTNEAKTLKNQLQALFMQTSPLLAMLIKEKDNEHLNELTEYFDSSANDHWAVLFPKARTLVKEPSVAESAAFKKITTNPATLLHQVQSISSQLSSNSQAAQSTYAATAAKAATTTTPKPPKPLTPKINTPRPRLVIWLDAKDKYPFYLHQ